MTFLIYLLDTFLRMFEGPCLFTDILVKERGSVVTEGGEVSMEVHRVQD